MKYGQLPIHKILTSYPRIRQDQKITIPNYTSHSQVSILP